MCRWGWLILLGITGCAAQITSDQAASQPAESPEGSPAGTPRKIIQCVLIRLEVEDVSAVGAQVAAAVSRSEGYVAASQVGMTEQQGHWTIRIPAPNLDEFVRSCEQLGTVLFKQSSADDVTSQYIDVNARLTTKRLEEERLQKLLTEQTGQLKEVLEVERELSRVRGEIELAQGQQRFLEHETAFAKVELQATEKPQPTWATQAPLPQQMANVLFRSWSLLLTALRAVLLTVIALIPRVGVSIIPISLIWYLRPRRPTRMSPRFD